MFELATHATVSSVNVLELIKRMEDDVCLIHFMTNCDVKVFCLMTAKVIYKTF